MLVTLSLALAADLVWLGPADDPQRAAVLAQAGGAAVEPIDLRAAATRATDADADAIRAVSAALDAARAYETQLDGELVIMRDLQRPLDAVSLVRSDDDRDALFAALAYQGFAVDRYFGADLAASEEAAPYRVSRGGLAVEAPWVDAVAIDPARKISAYDIAEAPQRVAYAEVQKLVLEGLPASIVPGALPARAQLVVDGRAATPDATGSIKVPAGRHWAHVTVDGRVLSRWSGRVDAGGEVRVEVPLTDAAWDTFLSNLAPGAPIPSDVAPILAAWGSPIWMARPGPKRPTILEVDAKGIREIEPAAAPAPPAATASRRFSVHAAALGGWTGGHDFYTQDPVNQPATAATVNAATVGVSAGGDAAIVGPLRVGVGVDVAAPLGAAHVAITGDRRQRLRPTPHATIGVRAIAIGAGYLLPYHPAVGARGAIPVVGPLELRWIGWLGLPSTRERDGADPYTTSPLLNVMVGAGVRL